MGRIRSRDTRPEIALRKALWAAGLRYRLKAGVHLPGHPDLAFPRAKVAVFVDGCFWHGCPDHGHIPKSRVEYWAPKIERNQTRDAQANAQLAELGWRVLRFWEHQVDTDVGWCVAQVLAAVSCAGEWQDASELGGGSCEG